MALFASTDFRDDLLKVTVPTLVIQGAGDAVVLFEGSGARTHAAISGSELHVIAGAPHGVNVSHADEWNRVGFDFLAKQTTPTHTRARIMKWVRACAVFGQHTSISSSFR